MPAPVDLAEEAFYSRATGDSTLTDELGHTSDDERIVWGRPEEVFGEEEDVPAQREFPLLTYFGVSGPELIKDFGQVRIQSDIWVWPEGSDGGLETMKAIDGRLYELFFEEQWTHNGRRFDVGATDWRGRPPDASQLLHRTREFLVGVNL